MKLVKCLGIRSDFSYNLNWFVNQLSCLYIWISCRLCLAPSWFFLMNRVSKCSRWLTFCVDEFNKNRIFDRRAKQSFNFRPGTNDRHVCLWTGQAVGRNLFYFSGVPDWRSKYASTSQGPVRIRFYRYNQTKQCTTDNGYQGAGE